jgi:hypothetical protein
MEAEERKKITGRDPQEKERGHESEVWGQATVIRLLFDLRVFSKDRLRPL